MKKPKERKVYGRVNALDFVMAYSCGKPLWECATYAGKKLLKGVSEPEGIALLRSAGDRILASTEVRNILKQCEPTMEAGWHAGIRYWAAVARGEVEVAARDRTQAIYNLGSALGKFVQKHEHAITGMIAYERLVRSEDIDTKEVIEASLIRPSGKPALPQGGSLDDLDEAVLLAALARKRAAATSAPTLPASTGSQVQTPETA